MLYELNKIKSMRQKLGLTQIDLAKLAKVSQSIITKIERGKIEPSYSIASKIFMVLEEQLAKNHKTIIAKNILTKKIIKIELSATIEKAMDLMKTNAISQLPVFEETTIVGSISEDTFIKNYDKIHDKRIQVKKIMDEPFPTMPENTSITLIKEILKTYSAVVITRNGTPIGIISKADLLKKL